MGTGTAAISRETTDVVLLDLDLPDIDGVQVCRRLREHSDAAIIVITAAPYVRKGPPALPLRLLGPVVMVTSVGVIGSGVALAIIGPRPSTWLLAHKALFVIWFGAMAIHVLWYAPRLPRLLRSGPAQADRARTALAGAGRRWLLVTAALVAGIVIALATYHLAGAWTGQAGPGQPDDGPVAKTAAS